MFGVTAKKLYICIANKNIYIMESITSIPKNLLNKAFLLVKDHGYTLKKKSLTEIVVVKGKTTIIFK